MNTTSEIDENELLTSLENRIAQCDSYAESEIGKSRDNGYKYYYGRPMGNERAGRSQHVSMDVFDATESVKSLLMETFSANKNVCKFEPQNAEDEMGARSATALVNWIFYRQNKGTKIIQDVLHDGLIAKTGIVKRYYKEDFMYEEEEFENLSEADFNVLASSPDVVISNVEEMSSSIEVMDQQSGQMVEGSERSFSGELQRRVDKSKVCVEVVAPEDFLISPRATSEEDADFCSHRASRTRGELLEEGYDPDVVDRMDDERDLHDDGSLGRDAIDKYRKDTNLDDDHDRMSVTVYESYLKKYDDELRACVYIKCIHSRKVLLDYEIVSELPFRYFTPFPLSHRFHGMSLADVLFDLQKTQSSLKRGVVDHTFMTNTSRFIANLALVKNPRDLLDNRVGAVIDVNSPNPEAVVRPISMPNLSGTVFQAIENLEVEKEQRSGMSRMARGMDSTVVSKQNSNDLITQFMNASNRRIMMMARNFAENFLAPLLVDLYRIALQYENEEKVLELDGQFTPIDPKKMMHRTEMKVAVALTPEEQTAEAQRLLTLDQQFTMNPNDPSAGGIYGPQQRHALLSRAFELLGIKEHSNYLFDPASPEAQQQAQMAQQQQAEMSQKQAEMEKFQAGMTARQVAVLEGQLELDVVKEQNKMILETTEMEFDQEEKDSRLLLDTEKTNHDMEMSEKELELEKTQNRNVSVG